MQPGLKQRPRAHAMRCDAMRCDAMHSFAAYNNQSSELLGVSTDAMERVAAKA
jgi:peroxiredoxin